MNKLEKRSPQTAQVVGEAPDWVAELQTAILARITLLLEKHEPGAVAQWRSRLEKQERRGCPLSPLEESRIFLFASAIIPLQTRYQEDDIDNPRVQRNYRLLVRLIYRGLVRRGEYIPARLRGGS